MSDDDQHLAYSTRCDDDQNLLFPINTYNALDEEIMRGIKIARTFYNEFLEISILTY